MLEERRSRATAEIAHAGLKSNVWGGGSKKAPCHETVTRRIGHLFSQLGESDKSQHARIRIRYFARVVHRRDIPSTLRKKPDRMIWNPSVKHTTPGITIRNVCPGSSGP